MNDVITDLYRIILERKQEPCEGSYTCYLFEQGLDKILKKVGEETAETLIAAKNGDTELLAGEVCDLLYHLLVLMAETGVDIGDVRAELERRREKIGNLKQMKKTDKDT